MPSSSTKNQENGLVFFPWPKNENIIDKWLHEFAVHWHMNQPKDVPRVSQMVTPSTTIARSASNTTTTQHSVSPLDQLLGINI
ncbi:hypothetical protein DAPPUDRAFT_262147 [Daphnia pulex]|uniref:Uncharacterized protein n=1 Tax=Daphnia pulex TaxID=6669 RepID=E9HMG4_DAPPU|nr:hypothetical protein DAPPUDRAFT_262147 [Daphnia pulex]|eukprot:EFX67077.1 hypothetical protein DAPPUDRAFT_262147 [Daphnia pulex]